MATLRQINYWLAVVEEGTFTGAAYRMHVSQPSLSQQIRALEREIGGELLERLPRSVQMTEAGKAFLPSARTTINAAERAVKSARSALQLETGELEISTVRSIAVRLLPQLVERWIRIHPSTHVRLREYTHRKFVEDAVREGAGDLGIGPPPKNWTGRLRRLGWEEFIVILAPNDELASRSAIPLSALSQRRWVLFEPGNGLHELVSLACSTQQFRPEYVVYTSQVETAVRLAAAGAGPALVPRNAVPPEFSELAHSADPPVGRELTLFSRNEWTPLAGAFVDFLEKQKWDQVPAEAVLIS